MSHLTPAAAVLPPERIAATGRSLAPDLARGFMLLAIALAHIPAFVSDWSLGPAALNETADFLRVLLFDNQARVMFIFLFGYGLGQFAHRRAASGADWLDMRSLLRRRGLWLLVIGFLHGVILVPLDFISVYGFTLLVLVGLVKARDKTLLAAGFAVLAFAIALTMWTEVEQLRAVAAGSDPGAAIDFISGTIAHHLLLGLQLWPVKVLGSVVMVVPGMLFGLWAARRRLLDEPAHHAALLRRLTVGLLAASFIGRLPYTLITVGAVPAGSEPMWWAASAGHSLGGYAGGIGAAALIGLVAIRLGSAPGGFAVAVSALGQRSMTFYIFQSAAFVALFYPFALDLRGSMGIAATFAVGAGIWLASLALAEWMRRLGYRGPFESALRRLERRWPRAKVRERA